MSGFWSKDEILTELYEHGHVVLLFIALITASMTAFYMFRSYFLTFEGEYKGHAHPHKPSKVISIPLIILAVPSALIGFILSGNLNWMGINSFNSFVHPLYYSVESHESLFIPIISSILALLGSFVAALMYWDVLKNKIDGNAQRLKIKLKPVYDLSVNKWYIDDVYYTFINKVFLPFSAIISWFDKNIVDGIVNLTAYITSLIGKLFDLLQNGNLQTYATILFGGFMVITLSLLIYWIF